MVHILIFKCLKTRKCALCALCSGRPATAVLFLLLAISVVRSVIFLLFFSFILSGFFFDRKYNLENSTIKHFLEMSKTTDATHNKPKRHKKQMQQNYQFHKRTRTNTLTHTHNSHACIRLNIENVYIEQQKQNVLAKRSIRI